MGHPSAFGPSSSQQPDRPQLQLVVHAGPLAGKGFPIVREVLTFGRDPDNDIMLDDSEVSRHHARLLQEDDQIILEDLGSTNGTLVNGKPIVGRHVMQPADIISIGASVFGVRGFAAPTTIGVTQVSPKKPPVSTYTPPAPSSPPLATPPRPAPPPRPASPPAQASEGLNMLAIGGIAALIVIVVIGAAISAYFLTRGRGAATASMPEVVITAPLNGSQVQLNSPLTIQATASDPAGVVRMELWVSGLKTAESISPVAQGQPTFTASFQWTPEAPGTYTLEIKAFNERGAANIPTLITVTAAGNTPTPTPTPTETTTPQPPTATAPTTPLLTTQTDLNVRLGPATTYDLLGLLPGGASAEIIGRSADGQWWQIRFSPAGDGIGWVSADPAFSQAVNVNNVPVVPAPPTPTAIPSDTPTPTPSATQSPPTATPTLTSTPTATGEAVIIQFEVSPQTIQGGECVRVKWNVTGVKEIYYQDGGVTGNGDLIECPKDDETYRLRVVKKDNSEQVETREVEVVNPIVSTGTIRVNSNQTVDFDGGKIPGNDFTWSVSDGTRRFEVQGGVQLAPMSDISDLKNLTLNECANANFGEYTYIDGSDDAPDEINELIPERAACFKTNEGRLGKLRFPDGEADSLKIEWLTWQ
ncbi:MAG: FHA domain-containing protein [Chloroflexota bacterium]